MLEIAGGIIVLLIMIALSGVKVVRAHERLVVFRFGKVIGSRGPGLQLVLPVIERLLVVDTRMVTMPVEVTETSTYDGAVVSLSLVFMFQVDDAANFVTKVTDAYQATAEAAQAVVREATKERVLSELQTDPRRLIHKVRVLLDRKIKTWGLKSADVLVKEVKLIAENRQSEDLQVHVEHVAIPLDYFADTNDFLKQPAPNMVQQFDGNPGQSYDFGVADTYQSGVEQSDVSAQIAVSELLEPSDND